MGRAAKRHSWKRAKYLASMAQTDAGRFDVAWEQRLQSWVQSIYEQAGEAGQKGVFRILDEAIKILNMCGEDAVAKHLDNTRRILQEACCKALEGRGVKYDPATRPL